MDHFKTTTPNGVAATFVALGVLYFLFMMFGVLIVRLPAPGWHPQGFVAAAQAPKKLVTTHDVEATEAIKTPQFWLLWIVLCFNVTAGIGVLGQASAMSQEMFPARITAAVAAGFVGLLSLANMAGRFFWASLSDYIGRKSTYVIFFVLGAVLYALVPTLGSSSVVLFVLFYVIILSMYGGGFATIPAYLRDLFGTLQVGAIHGRLLTAWSAAGVLGPVLVNYIREYQLQQGVPKAQAYSVTMYVMAGLLVIGLIANLAVRPVDPKHYYAGGKDNG